MTRKKWRDLALIFIEKGEIRFKSEKEGERIKRLLCEGYATKAHERMRKAKVSDDGRGLAFVLKQWEDMEAEKQAKVMLFAQMFKEAGVEIQL